MNTAAQANSCQIVDFQNYLEKKELEAHMKKIVNREIMLIAPTQLSQTADIGRRLLTGETVILNLNYLDDVVKQRFMDFVCGICYTIEGRLTCVSSGIYIISVDDYVDTAMADQKN